MELYCRSAIYIAIMPVFALTNAIFYQTHFHWDAFKIYARITTFILIDFVMSCWTFYTTHYMHLVFLNDIGFLASSDLVDSGKLKIFKDRDERGKDMGYF